MKPTGQNLRKRSLSLLQVLMILAVTFVAMTVVLQLQVEYNLLIIIYALSAVGAVLAVLEVSATAWTGTSSARRRPAATPWSGPPSPRGTCGCSSCSPAG